VAGTRIKAKVIHFLRKPEETRTSTIKLGTVCAAKPAPGAPAANILFVGNSFTFAAGTPIMTYRANTVTDLNRNGTASTGIRNTPSTRSAGSPGTSWCCKPARGL
jgi:hypothetical protein